MRRSPPVLMPAVFLVSAVTACSQHLQPSVRAAATDHATALRVTHVSLYKNGVGFFEHSGSVNGNAAITLDFTTAQLDDVLQSLTAIDLNGGRISGADFNSTTPLDQQLKNLALGLPADTSFSGFLTAIRGSRVEVRGSGALFTGRLMSVEPHKTSTGKDGGTTQTLFISVVSDTGTLRIFPVTPALSVRLLDTALHTDVTKYLQLLDSCHNQGVRQLTLLDRGAGTREVHLSYISDVPIWKSTYRILFTGSGTSVAGGNGSGANSGIGGSESGSSTATLQGWSVVDNTTGSDWIGVHLSLIAGVPQSFIQPLSQPIYGRRPVVPVAQNPQLTPQTYDSSIALDTISPENASSSQDSPLAARFKARPMAGMAGGSAGGVFGGIAVGSGSGAGIGAGSGGNMGGGVYHLGNGISYEEAQSASTTIASSAAGFDDFFAYDLTEPVTIRQNESALVPILQAKVPVDRVTLVSSDGYTVQQPLRALWITNTSGLTLDRGSFTLIENGNFSGQGLLDPIHAGEKRLLSYAADQAVHVATESNRTTQRVERITAAKGVITLHQEDVREITYLIHNAAGESRTVVLQHPIFPGYELDSTPAATETTATVYRFRETVGPGGTARLHVAEKHRGATLYQLTSSDDNQIQVILNETGHNAALEAALQPILEARRRVAEAQSAVDQTNTRLAALRADEDRQRANITALQNSDRRSRDRFVDELNRTEDAITSAQAELATRTAALDAAKADLANRIAALQIDEPA